MLLFFRHLYFGCIASNSSMNLALSTIASSAKEAVGSSSGRLSANSMVLSREARLLSSDSGRWIWLSRSLNHSTNSADRRRIMSLWSSFFGL